MSSGWPSLAAKTLADHEITLFYPIDGHDLDKGPDVYFRDLLSEGRDDVVPPDQRAGLGGRFEFMPIWQKVDPSTASAGIGIGADLHPNIRSILAGTRPDLATRWLLTDNARKLVTSADLYALDADKSGIERIKKALVYEPSSATEKRFAAFGLRPRKLRLTVERLDLVLFSTKKGFAQVRTTFTPFDDEGPLCALELLETIHALSRFNRLRWYAIASKNGVSSEFTLGSLIRRLCLGPAGEARVSRRVFTYALARFEEAIPATAADLFAIYAARHYTTDYALVHNSEGHRQVREFETIGHTVAIEGVATVIAPASEAQPLPEFLENFKNHTLHAHYLPITLLALHEHGFLVDKTSTALLTPQQRTVPDEMRQAFLQLAREALDFRVLFRHAEVSLITMHNALNRALRETFGLDRMLAEFSSDIAELSSFLQRQDLLERAEEEHKRNRRFWLFSVIGTGVLAALTVSALVKDGIKAFAGAQHGIGELSAEELAAFIAFIVGAIILVSTCAVGILNRPPLRAPGSGDAHDGHGFADHAASDAVLHQHRD